MATHYLWHIKSLAALTWFPFGVSYWEICGMHNHYTIHDKLLQNYTLNFMNSTLRHQVTLLFYEQDLSFLSSLWPLHFSAIYDNYCDVFRYTSPALYMYLFQTPINLYCILWDLTKSLNLQSSSKIRIKFSFSNTAFLSHTTK